MIHEICHFVAFEVFDNYGLPYSSSDQKSEGCFNLITYSMLARKGHLIPLFEEIFDRYKPTYHQSEAIVRVAQYLVLHRW